MVKDMGILLLSFSGRKEPGNCMKILKLIQGAIVEKGIKSTLLSMTDLNIKPCLGCNYECFDEEQNCNIKDDTEYIYKNILSSEMVVMCIPVYSSAPPSTYFSLRERAQSIFRTDELYLNYKKVKKLYIVIGKRVSGANDTINILKSDDENIKHDDILLLESNEFGQKAIEGKLVDCDKAVNKVRDFVSKHIK
jgi:multimeric flavodoxin WrbA